MLIKQWESESDYKTFVKENECKYSAHFLVGDAVFNICMDSEDVYSWDDAESIAKTKVSTLIRLIHKESDTYLTSREQYNHFVGLSNTKGISHVIIPSDVETKPSYTEEQKQGIIADMLLHFKELHDKRNQELVDSGYGNDIIPFDEISIQELKDYALSDTIWGKI